MSRFPAAFRLPAFRFSVILFPPGVGPSLRSAHRTGARTSTGMEFAFRTHELRPGGAGPLLHPKDGGAHPGESP